MVKKKYIYTGNRLLDGGKLGHSFELVGNSEKHLYFTDRKNFILGSIYEMDFKVEGSSRFFVGGYTGEDVEDIEKLKGWRVTATEQEADYKSKQMEKKRIKLAGDIGEMTINELKEKCRSNRSFRNTVLFYLMGSRIW